MKGIRVVIIENLVPEIEIFVSSIVGKVWLSLSMFLVLACSLANVTQLAPAGVNEWQGEAIETAVSDTDIVASSRCNFKLSSL